MKYFIQSIRFSPEIPEGLGLKKIDDGTYVLEEDMSIWGYRKLLDLGWGKEHGFFRVPMLSFDKLLQCVFDFDDEKIKIITVEVYNFFGALSVLIEDYASSFIQEIRRRFNEGKFNLKTNKFMIDYVNAEFDIDNQLIQRLKDKDIAKNCILWKKVYNEIKLKNTGVY